MPRQTEPRVVEDEAAQPLARTGGLGRHQRVAPDEIDLLVERDREPEPRLVRRLVRRDVARPDAVALLDPQRVDRAIAAGDHAVRRARLPERPPQRDPELGVGVELPAELPDVGDAQRVDRHGADRDGARGEEREGGVGDVVARDRGQDVARPRAPQREADAAGRQVVEEHAAIGRQVPAQPGQVVLPERGAR